MVGTQHVIVHCLGIPRIWPFFPFVLGMLWLSVQSLGARRLQVGSVKEPSKTIDFFSKYKTTTASSNGVACLLISMHEYVTLYFHAGSFCPGISKLMEVVNTYVIGKVKSRNDAALTAICNKSMTFPCYVGLL